MVLLVALESHGPGRFDKRPYKKDGPGQGLLAAQRWSNDAPYAQRGYLFACARPCSLIMGRSNEDCY